MRGKVVLDIWIIIRIGITPAYAGKSLLELVAVVGRRDHPRLCGEKETNVQKIKERLGSPPPMRGKGGLHLFAADRQGITPAYAGKSFTSKFPEFHHGDHPRLCGEKRGTSRLERNHEGSPPPMRGKV